MEVCKYIYIYIKQGMFGAGAVLSQEQRAERWGKANGRG